MIECFINSISSTNIIIILISYCGKMHKKMNNLLFPNLITSAMNKSFGFFASTWLGWATGCLLMKPWGRPSFKSWITWITFWSIAVLLVQHTFLLDFCRHAKLFDALAMNRMAKRIHEAVFIVAYGAFWTVRLVFLVHAKKLVNLLNALHVYHLEKEYLRWRTAWRVAILFICLSAAFVMSSAVVFVLAVRSKPLQDSPSWFYVFGKLVSGIMWAFFGHLCSMSSINVAFALVIYISFYLGMIYCDFCNEVEEFMQANRNALFSKQFAIARDDNFKKAVFDRSPLSKEILLNKFEGIRALFDAGNKIIFPLALTIIVVETFRGVSVAHELLINNLGGLFLLDYYLNVSQQIIHAGLVFVGQYVEDRMDEKKKELEEILALTEDTDANEECTIKLVKYVIAFDWKLSAYGFFNVDKKLLSGV